MKRLNVFSRINSFITSKKVCPCCGSNLTNEDLNQDQHINPNWMYKLFIKNEKGQIVQKLFNAKDPLGPDEDVMLASFHGNFWCRHCESISGELDRKAKSIMFGNSTKLTPGLLQFGFTKNKKSYKKYCTRIRRNHLKFFKEDCLVLKQWFSSLILRHILNEFPQHKQLIKLFYKDMTSKEFYIDFFMVLDSDRKVESFNKVKFFLEQNTARVHLQFGDLHVIALNLNGPSSDTYVATYNQPVGKNRIIEHKLNQLHPRKSKVRILNDLTIMSMQDFLNDFKVYKVSGNNSIAIIDRRVNRMGIFNQETVRLSFIKKIKLYADYIVYKLSNKVIKKRHHRIPVHMLRNFSDRVFVKKNNCRLSGAGLKKNGKLCKKDINPVNNFCLQEGFSIFTDFIPNDTIENNLWGIDEHASVVYQKMISSSDSVVLNNFLSLEEKHLITPYIISIVLRTQIHPLLTQVILESDEYAKPVIQRFPKAEVLFKGMHSIFREQNIRMLELLEQWKNILAIYEATPLVLYVIKTKGLIIGDSPMLGFNLNKTNPLERLRLTGLKSSITLFPIAKDSLLVISTKNLDLKKLHSFFNLTQSIEDLNLLISHETFKEYPEGSIGGPELSVNQIMQNYSNKNIMESSDRLKSFLFKINKNSSLSKNLFNQPNLKIDDDYHCLKDQILFAIESIRKEKDKKLTIVVDRFFKENKSFKTSKEFGDLMKIYFKEGTIPSY